MTNAINPSHYKSDTIECIDAMKACSTPEEFRGHLKLTALKYLWREDKKGEGDQARVENLEKAAWYLDRLVKDLRGENIVEFKKETVWADDLSGFSTREVIGEMQTTVVVGDSDKIPPHTINAADNLGWIEWRGGECPVDPETIVEVMFGDGYIGKYKATRIHWDWADNGKVGDVVRYKVIK